MANAGRVGNARPRLSIAIVNWNGGALLAQCLDSLRVALARPGAPSARIIVVDNGSTDGSVGKLGDDVELIRNPTNRGFGAACNQAAARVDSDFLLFLNPDCRVAAGSIEACLARLQAEPAVGVAGIALHGDDGSVQRSCHRFPRPAYFFNRLSGLSALFACCADGSMQDWAHDTDRRVDHVIGAFYLVRTREFRALGGFDERFFVYLEDLDLSLRYSQHGQHCLFVAAPASYHKGGGISQQVRAARLFYATRSRILFAFKHFGAAQGWLHLGATLTVEPLARLAQALAHGRPRDGGQVLRGFALLYRDLPATLRLARRE